MGIGLIAPAGEKISPASSHEKGHAGECPSFVPDFRAQAVRQPVRARKPDTDRAMFFNIT
jgi:hypothetical protein